MNRRQTKVGVGIEHHRPDRKMIITIDNRRGRDWKRQQMRVMVGDHTFFCEYFVSLEDNQCIVEVKVSSFQS